MELELASNRPLFTGTPMRVAHPGDLYPHVYDSMAKAKLTSAYLDGKSVRKNYHNCSCMSHALVH